MGGVGSDRQRLALILGVMLVVGGSLRAQVQDERLRLVRAARLSGQTVDGRVLQRLEGDVLFRQGQATMSCEQALRDEAAGTVVFMGRVRIDTGRRRLYAERVAYNEFSRVEEAEGHPVVYDSTRRLAAERLTYFEPEERALAVGRVVLADTARFTTLTCGRAEYFRATGYAVATHSPRLVKTDSTGGDSLVLSGDKMEVFDAGARALVTDSVTLRKGRLVVRCGRAEYFDDEEKVLLTAAPHGVYGQDHIRGTTMEVYLSGQEVRRIVVQGDALITSPSDSLNPETRVNRLTGQRVTIQLAEEQIREMTIEEQATSLYHVLEEGEFKGVNLISGDRILLYLEDGKLRRVRIESAPGKTSGVFYPPRLEGAIPADNGRGTRRATG
ncbi:MAG: hypothetical protein H5U38_06940 [Calditrichaeota bacterium]|nr:hypothetical protein [Calditrichota bacterium]